MILIVGGVAQGKTAFAESFHLPVLDHLEHKIKTVIEEELEKNTGLSQAEMEEKVKVEMRGWIQETLGVKKIQQLEEASVVIVSREIGCGIVPMGKIDAMWREITGRCGCYLAKHAEEVYKMEAGIAVKIK